MGNSLGRRKRAKVMKIDGETLKLKTPIQVVDVVRDHPGHVLLDSEAVKHFGVRAKPLEPEQELKPKKIYFLVQLPKFEENQVAVDREKQPVARRVRSSVQLNAKDRLELLMLSRRSISDLASSSMVSGGAQLSSSSNSNSGPMQVKVRLPKAKVAKLVEESNDDREVAEKIINLYMVGDGGDHLGVDGLNERRKMRLGSVRENTPKAREKRVSFVPMERGEIHSDVNIEQ